MNLPPWLIIDFERHQWGDDPGSDVRHSRFRLGSVLGDPGNIEGMSMA